MAANTASTMPWAMPSLETTKPKKLPNTISIISMVAGSLLPQRIGLRQPDVARATH